MNVSEVPASLVAFGAPPSPATARVVEQGPEQRIGRALAALGGFWALALVSLFIPVAHFVLVPSFLVAGVVAGALRLREDRRLLEVRGACPRCGAQQRFTVGGRFGPARRLDCPACHQILRLVAGPDPGGRGGEGGRS